MPEAQTLPPPTPMTERETVQIDVVQRVLQIRAESFNESERTVEVVFTTGARRSMFSWSRWEYVDEELSTDANSVRMERINNGGPVLNSHRSYDLADQIGVVVDGSARMEAGEGIATLRFSSRPELEPIIRDIRDGIIRNISVGYIVYEYEITEREGQRTLYRAVDWEPAEISFVTIPADPGAGVRSEPNPAPQGAGKDAAQGGFPCIFSRAAISAPANLEVRMNPNEPTGQPAPAVVEPATAARAADPAPVAPANPAATATVTDAQIRTLAMQARIPADAILEMQSRNAVPATAYTHESLVADIGTRWAAQGAAAAPSQNRIGITADEGVKVRSAIEAAIEHRCGNRTIDLQTTGASEFRSLSLVELGRDMARRNGETAIARADSMTVAAYMVRAGGMHASSDFPLILANQAGKTLRAAYQAAPRVFANFVRTVELPDFKPASFVALGDAPKLEKTSESGEIKRGSFSEDAESVQIEQYSKGIAVTRKMIVNDDLNAFARIPEMFGRRAAELESDLVITNILVGNPSLRTGGALFQAAAPRGNNLASAGTAITIPALSAGRAVMRKQKGLDGAHLNIAPRYMLVGPDKETEADQMNAAILANVTGNANVFQGRFEVLVDPRVAGNMWFLIAEPAMVDTIVLAYLTGRVGPVVEEAMEFDVDGMKLRCLSDVAAAPIDFRGFYRNPGA